MNSTDRLSEERRYTDHFDFGAVKAIFSERNGVSDDHLVDLTLDQAMDRWS
jgi:hypothetical protein